MGDVYNLQVKLDRKTEKILRQLAKEDDRTLSNYCMVVLKKLAEEHNLVVDVEEKVVVSKPKTLKKSVKVEKPQEKPPQTEKSVEIKKTETISLSNDMPSITGHFRLT